MYSVILMAAMTSAPDAPNCHFKACCKPYCPPPCYVSCCGCGGYVACYGNCGGCYGGCYGGCVGYSCGGACLGCYGVYPTYSYSMPLNGVPMMPAIPAEPVLPKPKEKEPEKDGSSARLTFDLPPGAALYVDGQLIKGASTRRQFSTPKLQAGQAYYYDVRVEVVRDGKVIADEKRVVVRAGEAVAATFGRDRLEGTAFVAR